MVAVVVEEGSNSFSTSTIGRRRNSCSPDLSIAVVAATAAMVVFFSTAGVVAAILPKNDVVEPVAFLTAAVMAEGSLGVVGLVSYVPPKIVPGGVRPTVIAVSAVVNTCSNAAENSA